MFLALFGIFFGLENPAYTKYLDDHWISRIYFKEREMGVALPFGSEKGPI